MPDEIKALLDSNEATRELLIEEIIPEFVTPLPERGEGRNHDSLVRARRGATLFTIGIEAKTDETFDRLIGDRIKAAEKASRPTRLPHRAASLLKSIFGRECDPRQEPFCGLRYQLVTAAAGSAAQALIDGADYAVCIVHELRTWKCVTERLNTNGRDYAAFISAAFGPASDDVQPDQLYGPIQVSFETPARKPIQLFAGKAVSPAIEKWSPNLTTSPDSDGTKPLE